MLILPATAMQSKDFGMKSLLTLLQILFIPISFGQSCPAALPGAFFFL